MFQSPKMSTPKTTITFECADGEFQASTWYSLENEFQFIGGKDEILNQLIVVTVMDEGEFRGKQQNRIEGLILYPYQEARA